MTHLTTSYGEYESVCQDLVAFKSGIDASTFNIIELPMQDRHYCAGIDPTHLHVVILDLATGNIAATYKGGNNKYGIELIIELLTVYNEAKAFLDLNGGGEYFLKRIENIKYTIAGRTRKAMDLIASRPNHLGFSYNSNKKIRGLYGNSRIKERFEHLRELKHKYRQPNVELEEEFEDAYIFAIAQLFENHLNVKEAKSV